MIGQALAGAAALLLLGVGWIVGGRLLLLSHRTRQLPELALGLDFLLIGGLGYPLAIAADALVGRSLLVAGVVATVASLTVSHLGMLGHCAFTRLVFRPQERWARALVGACALAVVIGFALGVHVGAGWLARGIATPAERMGGTLFLMAVSTATCAWSATEAFSYHAKMRRRLSLGLVEPVVANRFLLFGIHSTSTTIGCLVNAWFAVTSPLSVLDPTALSIAGLCGGVGAVAVILGFMPPARYLRWIAARHAVRTARAPLAGGAPESERAA